MSAYIDRMSLFNVVVGAEGSQIVRVAGSICVCIYQSACDICEYALVIKHRWFLDHTASGSNSGCSRLTWYTCGGLILHGTL